MANVKETTLTELMGNIIDHSIEVVDLTHVLNEDTPVIQLPEPFVNTKGFKIDRISKYDDNGPFFYWNNISMGEHCGTHFDAPVHWISGRGHQHVDEIPAEKLIGEACVINIKEKCDNDPDYLLTIADIEEYEANHGKIPPHSWVLVHTGWDKYVDDKRFLNVGEDGQSHTPGPTAEAAEFLATKRDILGFGVEPVGTDAGLASTFETPFPAHYFMHQENKYGLASLKNLDKLPPRGSIVIASPLRIDGGSGSPARVMALVENS
ncbi:cyclase family protein [Salicibibacter kimchii]|uniref:Cyclase family protein n=1 Tax=Salicibibacter kimchii TaxID=2099786 RepID=A0A345C173_9BACI|nr:cyclase family protein [Salicibibacter kimchii]AXF56954.1 cyclase family protein [Salicibibacter kimchii]